MKNIKVLATRKYFSFSLAKGGQAYCWGIAYDGTVVCDHMPAESFQQQRLYYKPDELIWPMKGATPEDQRHYLKMHRGEKLDSIIRKYEKYLERNALAKRRQDAKDTLSKYLRDNGFYSWALGFGSGYIRFAALGAFGSEKKITEGPAGTTERFVNGLKKPLAEVIFTSPTKKNKAAEYICTDATICEGELVMTLVPQHKKRR